MSEILLTVKVKVKEEFEFAVFSYMQALHKLTHENDEGCIQYDLHTVKDQDSTFYFIERWKDQASLDAHMAKDHFVHFQKFTEDKIESFEVNILERA